MTKTTRKKKTPTPLKTWVTLREIEEQSPCAGEYAHFLRDMGSRPVPGDAFDEPFVNKYVNRYVKAPGRYGPDAPISLLTILETKSSSWTPLTRLQWLGARIDGVGATLNAWIKRKDEALDNLNVMTMREICTEVELGGPLEPLKLKKRRVVKKKVVKKKR